MNGPTVAVVKMITFLCCSYADFCSLWECL